MGGAVASAVEAAGCDRSEGRRGSSRSDHGVGAAGGGRQRGGRRQGIGAIEDAPNEWGTGSHGIVVGPTDGRGY